MSAKSGFRPSLLLPLAAAVVLAWAAPARPAPPPQDHEELHEESALEGYMADIDGTVRKLRNLTRSPETLEEALAELCRLQKVVVDAKSELPPKVAELADEAAWAAARAEYRLEMQGLLRGMLDVEAAILTGDAQAIQESIQALNELKQEGHRKFKPRR